MKTNKRCNVQITTEDGDVYVTMQKSGERVKLHRCNRVAGHPGPHGWSSQRDDNTDV